MKTIVAYSRQAEIEFDAWLQHLEQQGADAEGLVQLYMVDFRVQLEKHKGIHPEAVREGEAVPATYRVRFILDLEISYTLEEVRRWFRRPYRLVTIQRFRRVP